MRNFFAVFLIITFHIVYSKAQDYQANVDSSKIYRFTLNEALDFAIIHNYKNQISLQDIEIAKKQIWETTAIGLPQVSVSGDYSNMLQIPTQLIPGDFMGMPGSFIPVKFGQQHDLAGSITATQLIFSGEYIVGLQASRIFLKLSQQSYNKSVKEIKETLAKSYYLVLIAQESKKILKETGDNIEKLLAEIRETYKLGFVADTDVDQLMLTKQNNDNTIISINKQIEISKRLLKFQLGLSYKDSLILVDSLNGFVQNIDADAILSDNFELNNNIDYKLLETKEQLALLNIKREKSKFLPQLSAFFTHKQSTYSNEFDKIGDKWYPSSILGLQLKIPIFSSGSRISVVQQKQIEFEKLQYQKQELEEGMLLKVEQARVDLINAQNSFTNQKLSLELAKKININTEIKYKKGLASSNELMIAQNQYLSSLSKYYKAVNELLDAKTTLEYLLTND